MPFVKNIENPLLKGAVEWLISLGFAVLLFFFVRAFVFRIAHVDGNSMMPTLAHGDMVVLNRFVYIFSSPRAGDIVAFPYPGNPSDVFIKRVVAVGGDTVDMRYGYFYVNDERLSDEFSQAPTRVAGNVTFPVEVEDGYFFVLGDNRDGSQDSRMSSVGNVRARDMVGRARIRVWPFSRIGRVR